MRLIDADALKSKVKTVGVADAVGNYYGACDVVFEEDIEAAPTIGPVKHGWWIGEQVEIGGSMCMECNRCHKIRAVDDYCSSCGARMDADE